MLNSGKEYLKDYSHTHAVNCFAHIVIWDNSDNFSSYALSSEMIMYFLDTYREKY